MEFIQFVEIVFFDVTFMAPPDAKCFPHGLVRKFRRPVFRSNPMDTAGFDNNEKTGTVKKIKSASFHMYRLEYNLGCTEIGLEISQQPRCLVCCPRE